MGTTTQDTRNGASFLEAKPSDTRSTATDTFVDHAQQASHRENGSSASTYEDSKPPHNKDTEAHPHHGPFGLQIAQWIRSPNWYSVETMDQFLLWQLADSAFPSGGFAHSGGLESVAQWGLIRDHRDLLDYLPIALYAVRDGQLPFVNAVISEPQEFEAVDRYCDAFLNSHVANRGSRRQGQSFLASAAKIFPVKEIQNIAASAHATKQPRHLPTVFGAVCGQLGVEAQNARRLFMFLSLRGWISSAVRLGIVGPIEGQSIQHSLGETCRSIADPFENTSIYSAAQCAPVLEVLQGTHDRMYSKLFQS